MLFMYTCADSDMGYGPAVAQNRSEASVVGVAKSKKSKTSDNQSGFHPQAPPITATDGTAQQGDAVVNFDSNFIMMKKSNTTEEIQQVVYLDIDLHTMLYLDIDLYTVLYLDIDLYTMLYLNIDLYTVLYRDIILHTIILNRILFNTV